MSLGFFPHFMQTFCTQNSHLAVIIEKDGKRLIPKDYTASLQYSQSKNRFWRAHQCHQASELLLNQNLLSPVSISASSAHERSSTTAAIFYSVTFKKWGSRNRNIPTYSLQNTVGFPGRLEGQEQAELRAVWRVTEPCSDASWVGKGTYVGLQQGAFLCLSICQPSWSKGCLCLQYSRSVSPHMGLKHIVLKQGQELIPLVLTSSCSGIITSMKSNRCSFIKTDLFPKTVLLQIIIHRYTCGLHWISPPHILVQKF